MSVTASFLVSFLVLLQMHNTIGLTFTSCGDEEIRDCQCYSNLVSQVISDDRNHYNMQRAFFPPNTANPVVVEITFNFSLPVNGATNNTVQIETWLWSESTFYLIQPIESLQFTSLLFTDNQLRKEKLLLYLPVNCYKENDVQRDDMLQLFTQRLKLYAMKQSVTAVIDNMYNPKAESVNTIKRYHTGSTVPYGNISSEYALVFQIFFPFCIIIYIIIFFMDRLPSEETDVEAATSTVANITFSPEYLNKIIICVCSCTIVCYVFGLDIAALARSKNVDVGIIFNWDTLYPNPNFNGVPKTDFGIPVLILIQDLIIMFITAICSIYYLHQICEGGLANKCACLLLGPISCAVVHSFHILIGFIHTSYHATSVFILYAGAFFVYLFAMRAAFNMLQKNSVHKICIIVSMTFLSFILFAAIVVVYLLLLFAPINLATEDGPTQIRSVSALALAVVAAAGTYKLLIKPGNNQQGGSQQRQQHNGNDPNTFELCVMKSSMQQSTPESGIISNTANTQKNSRQRSASETLAEDSHSIEEKPKPLPRNKPSLSPALERSGRSKHSSQTDATPMKKSTRPEKKATPTSGSPPPTLPPKPDRLIGGAAKNLGSITSKSFEDSARLKPQNQRLSVKELRDNIKHNEVKKRPSANAVHTPFRPNDNNNNSTTV